MIGNRIMVMVIFLNIAATVSYFLSGQWMTGVGWLCATMWSMKYHGSEMKLYEITSNMEPMDLEDQEKGEGETEENDDIDKKD